jgi:hypothetical protein
MQARERLKVSELEKECSMLKSEKAALQVWCVKLDVLVYMCVYKYTYVRVERERETLKRMWHVEIRESSLAGVVCEA